MRLLTILFLALLSIPVTSQQPTPLAAARFCGNIVVHVHQQQKLARQIFEEGCVQAIFVPIDDNYVLGYGVFVDVIGGPSRHQLDGGTR